MTTFDDNILKLVAQWQHAWTLAESFDDSTKWWDEAAAAAEAVRSYTRDNHFDPFPDRRTNYDDIILGIIEAPSHLATLVARLRSSWIRSQTGNSSEKHLIIRDMIGVARGAYIILARQEGHEYDKAEKLSNEFVSSMRSTLTDMSIAQGRVNHYC